MAEPKNIRKINAEDDRNPKNEYLVTGGGKLRKYRPWDKITRGKVERKTGWINLYNMIHFKWLIHMEGKYDVVHDAKF